MRRDAERRLRAALRVYAYLLALYPRSHREEFGGEMMRTFEDSYLDASAGRAGAGAAFWISVSLDELRSILREHFASIGVRRGLNTVVLALMVVLAITTLVWPKLNAARDWRALVFAVVPLGIVVLASPWASRAGQRLGNVGAVVVVTIVAALESILAGDFADILAPALLVAGLFLTVRILTVAHVALRRARPATLVPVEIQFGVAVGLVLITGVAVGLVDPDDNFVAVSTLLFYLAAPALCAIAGFKGATNNHSPAVAASSGAVAMLLGIALVLLARPALFAVFVNAGMIPAPTPIEERLLHWQTPMADILFFGSIAATAGAFLGREAALQRSALPRT